MKRKLMALMLAGIMVIQSAGISWATEFTDGVNEEYGDSSENGNEEAFSDEQTETEDLEDDSPEKDLTEESEVPAMASGDTSDENVKVSFDNGTLTISGSGMITRTSVKGCGHSLNEIKTIIIKKGITSIGDYTFGECSSLNSIEISNSVTSIGDYAFYLCHSLNSIEIPNSVTSIGDYAFRECSSLNNIEIPNSVTSIEGSAFYCCDSLNSIEIPNSVTSIGDNAFYGCRSLNNIEIPNSVTSIGDNAFYECSSLNSIEIPNSVTSIGDNAFYLCHSLNSIEIPNSVTSIGDYAFYECSSLNRIEIPNSITSIGHNAFYECSSLNSIEIPNSITSIGDNAFYECSSLNSIEIPNSVTSIGYGVFCECSSLNRIEIPNSVTSIGDNAFYKCSSLNRIEIPSSVTSIGDHAFLGCRSLNRIEISNGVTSIGDGVFSGCSSLNSIEIPNSVTSIGDYAFSGCNINRIEIPNSVTSIGDGVFSGCSSLNRIEIPNGVTSIGDKMFSGCNSLNRIEIPSSVTSIRDWAFYGCRSLNSIKIPNSVTSIWDWAFMDCSSLNSIEISNSVTIIGDYAFSGCNITDVYYAGNKTQWEKVTISTCGNRQLLEAAIHYNSTVSTNKKFNLSIKSPAILGNQNSISVDFEASTPGSVANEEKAITWKSSNPAIAEIDKNTTGLIDSADGNSAFGWINLLTYDIGEVTITGTTQDGRTASVTINVEPKLQSKNSTFNISEKTAVTICSVQLKNGNKQYLESFMKSLKVQDTGSYLAGTYVKIDKTEYQISDDGKTADLICTFTPIGDGNEASEITCTSPNGQSISISIGKESIGTFNRDIDQYVLSEVKKYTNNKFYAQYDAIMSAKISGDEKLRRLNELFSNAGITDVKEGVQYISDVSSHQRSYRYLTTNEIYCAYNFLEWLYDGTLGNLRRGLLYADGLIFNGEIFDYTDLSTFTEADYPGVKKNKALLKKILEMDNSNIGTTTFKNANTLAKYLKNILSLNGIKSTDEMNRVMDEIVNCTSAEKLNGLQNQFVELLSKELKHNNKGTVYFDGELFSKALGKSAKILKFGGALAEDITAVINLESDLEKYNKNSRFLQNIYQNKDVSFEMRLAAYRIEYELKTGYYYQLTSILGDIMDFGVDVLYTDKSIVSEYLNKAGISSETTGLFGDAFSTIKFATFVSNIVVDMGDFVKQAAYTQGYGELSALYSLKLENDKNAFLNRQSYENAWTFFEDYTMLWNLRKMGEEQYLGMNEVKMYLFSKVPTLNYDMKVEIVKDTLSELEKCKFNIPSQYTIPASIQYSEKAVIHCPVNVAVCLKNGKQIAYLKDGTESDVTNSYGRFAVVREAYSGEYVKVVCLKDKENVEFKIIGTADGTMQMEFATSDDKTTGNIYKIREVTVSSKSVIQTTVSDIVNKNVYYVDKDGDGKVDEKGNFVVTDDTSCNPVPTPLPTITVTPTPTSSPIHKPVTPNLKIVIPTYNVITFKWSAVSNADGYQVYRKVNSGKWKSVKTTTGLVYKDRDTKAGYKYSYTVKAYKLIDGKKVYSGYDKKGLSGKLNTTVSLKAKNNTVSVSWKKTNGASGYYIYRATSKKGKYSKIKTITSGKTLKYIDKKVKSGKSYYYKVIPFRKINGKAVKGAYSKIKSIALREANMNPNSDGKYSIAAQKLIDYLLKNGEKWKDSSGGIDYTIHHLEVGNGSVTFQYQSAHDDQKSVLWMSYNLGLEINSKSRECITLQWLEQDNSDFSRKNEILVNYMINGNDDSVGISISADSFTRKSKIEFHNWSLKDYTLEQMNEKANKRLQEAMPLFESCLKKGDSDVTMTDLGFTKYSF